jgi:hypothetical protein
VKCHRERFCRILASLYSSDVHPFLSFTVPPACEDNGIASKDTFHHE